MIIKFKIFEVKNKNQSEITLLKTLLDECSEGEQLIFKRMYSANNLEASINDVVDNMDKRKLKWATQQVKNTHKKNFNKELNKYNL